MTAARLAAWAFALILAVPASAMAEFNVRDYGATGNGSTDDDAIDRASGVSNVHFTGSGTIDGDGNLSTSNSPPSGAAKKAIALVECANVSLTGISIRRGGHFMALLNGCHDVMIDNLKTYYADEGVRDGINLINSWNVTVQNSRIESSDDSIVLKSDYALGHTYTSQNIRVRDTTVYSHENNALQFGSETCGSFRDIRFANITVLGGGKAGIGIVSMDGAIIEDVHYTGISLTKTTTPIFMKIGERRRCPGSPPAGRIRNIHLTDVAGVNLTAPEPSGTTGGSELTSTITGYSVTGATTLGGALRVRATNSTPVPGQPVSLYGEAESGTVTAPMRALQDPAASGGACVSVAPGNDSKSSAPSTGHATLSFDVARPGTSAAPEPGPAAAGGGPTLNRLVVVPGP
ncbi:glycosyl hydrolase family 28 protein [Nonomuraea sp. NPDC046802]|uniref:glycosyl hydrolase family 28 protein n=1 Tax=Nonomuraea sp. NPDC046802 TaxID=3154919 RepID=UPI0033FDEC2B